ncbi:MAG: helix-turn-helix domain-containing protein [Thermaerobacter sp.]|nr:helix-turn-helix domain-containing protein [Thermaerobacter sp.]
MKTRVHLDVVGFGERLRWFREARRLAPEELAELANYARRSLGSPGRPFTGSWIRLMERGAEGALGSVAYYRLASLGMALEIAPERLVPQTLYSQRVEMNE